jgi:hypothetical protein
MDLGKDIIMISFHQNCSEYADFICNRALDWPEIVSGIESFPVSLASAYKMKPLDLKYLAEDE